MRTLLPAFAMMLLAAPAFAGSIEPVAGDSSESASIATIRCDDCPALKPKAKSTAYHVEAIEPGTQKVEIREENGERRIFRTEAWMGGSPVLFVSKAPAEAVIDAEAKTSALDATASHAAATASMTTSREFDPAGFELRVN